MSRARIFGVWLDALDMDGTVERCAELIEERRPVQHVVLNASKVVLMADVPGLRDHRAMRHRARRRNVGRVGRTLLGAPVPERVAGIDLMERLLGLCETSGLPVYFLGATEEVLGVSSPRLSGDATRRSPSPVLGTATSTR